MSEAKYYTPTIDEFHVGFEFEVINANGKYFIPGVKEGEYIKLRLGLGVLMDLNNTLRLLTFGDIRVKHLDHDDFVELGWKLRGDCDSFDIWDKNKSYWQVDAFRYQSEHGIDGHGFYNENNLTILYIRNKSELKKVMKQLGI